MEAQVEELLHLCRRSLVNTGTGIFPHYFNIKSSKLHHDLSDMLVLKDESVVMAYPREFGKSTYCWLAMAAWVIMFRKYRYIMFITDSLEKGKKQFLSTRKDVIANPILKSMIQKVVKDTSTELQLMIDDKIYYMSVSGSGQSLRGARYQEIRPDLIILDDIETTEGVRTKEQREKTKEWFYSDVMPLGKSSRLFYVGTMLHEDCLLSNLIEEPPVDANTNKKWLSRCYGVVDEKGDPTWPEKYDEDWIERKRKSYIVAGQLYRFNTEYMNVAVARDDRIFSPINIRFYSKAQFEAIRSEGIDIIGVLDPGIKQKEINDPTVIWVSGMDSQGNIWVIDIMRGRWRKSEILDNLYDSYERNNPRCFYLEAVQGQDYLVQDVEENNWKGKTNLRFERIDIKQIRMGKEVRIANLEDIFTQKKILLPANAIWIPEFINELVTFPRGKHDDILDCLSYSRLNHLKSGGRFFTVEQLVGEPTTVF